MGLMIEDMQEGYHKVVEEVIRRGSQAGNTTEVLGFGVTLLCPYNALPVKCGRGINLGIAAYEAASVISGISKPGLITAIAPAFEQFMDDGKFHGAYGPRAHQQADYVVQELSRDRFSRRAVISLWKPELDQVPGKHDYPCTNTLQFFIRDGFLDMQVFMRSNDVWRGFAYDTFQFSQLQLSLASRLGVPAGFYNHFASSMHLYDSDKAAAVTMLNKGVTASDTEIERALQPIGSLTVDEAGALMCGHNWSNWEIPSDLHIWFKKQLERRG